MTCQTCGRPAENGQQTHWIGCQQIRPAAEEPKEPKEPAASAECEYDGCSQPKWSDGPRTKFCVDHKDPKNREK
jgi:hypothetical protein